MKQNLDKSNCIKLFPSNSRVPESPRWLSRHWEFDLSLRTRELNLSHMPNPLDMNRIKVVRVFDSVCTNVVRSIAELYYLWYVLATLVCWSLQLLLAYYVCLQKNRN